MNLLSLDITSLLTGPQYGLWKLACEGTHLFVVKDIDCPKGRNAPSKAGVFDLTGFIIFLRTFGADYF